MNAAQVGENNAEFCTLKAQCDGAQRCTAWVEAAAFEPVAGGCAAGEATRLSGSG